MSAHPKPSRFWAQLADKFRLKGSAARLGEALPEAGEDGLLAEPAGMTGGDGGDPTREPPRPTGRWGRREDTLVQVQQGHEKLAQAIENIQQSLAHQQEQSERICSSLDQLNRSLQDVSAHRQRQTEGLAAIAGQLEATSERTGRCAQLAEELGKLTRSQSEAMAGINRQLEATSEQSILVAQTVEKLSTTLNQLNESSRDQAQVLNEMSRRAGERHQHLARLTARQTKRFTLLLVTAVALGIVAVATAVVGLLFRAP